MMVYNYTHSLCLCYEHLYVVFHKTFSHRKRFLRIIALRNCFDLWLGRQKFVFLVRVAKNTPLVRRRKSFHNATICKYYNITSHGDITHSGESYDSLFWIDLMGEFSIEKCYGSGNFDVHKKCCFRELSVKFSRGVNKIMPYRNTYWNIINVPITFDCQD